MYGYICICSWGPDDDGKTVDGPHFLAAVSIIDYC